MNCRQKEISHAALVQTLTLLHGSTAWRETYFAVQSVRIAIRLLLQRKKHLLHLPSLALFRSCPLVVTAAALRASKPAATLHHHRISYLRLHRSTAGPVSTLSCQRRFVLDRDYTYLYFILRSVGCCDRGNFRSGPSLHHLCRSFSHPLLCPSWILSFHLEPTLTPLPSSSEALSTILIAPTCQPACAGPSRSSAAKVQAVYLPLHQTLNNHVQISQSWPPH